MDVKLPPLGEGADSGTVVNLFVKEGDQITQDQPVLELENEKAVATIPSSAAGTVTKVYVKTGDKVSVGQRLFAISEGGSAAKPAKAPGPQPARAKPREQEPEESPEEDKADENEPAEAEAPKSEESTG